MAGILTAIPVSVDSARAQTHFGTWLNTEKKGKIELRECGNDQLCSEIVWLKEPHDENGEPWRDILNPEPSKRGRPVIGIDVLEGLKKIGPRTWQGQIYDPEEGKKYYLKHIKIGSEQVEIRGCLSTGWPCRTKYWTRTTPVRKPKPVQVAKPRPVPKPEPVQRQASAAPAPQPQQQALQRQNQAAPQPAQPQLQQQVPQRQAAMPPRPTAKPQPPAQRRSGTQQPQPRPQAQPQAAKPWGGQATRVAPTRPVTTGALNRPAQPRPMAAAPAGSGYHVQVTAAQDQNEALQTYGKLQHRYPHILGGYLPNVQRVDLGPKGIWYRVRIGPLGARTAAVDFCDKLKQAGGDCIIRNQ